jgi:hypothetical protein
MMVPAFGGGPILAMVTLPTVAVGSTFDLSSVMTA